MRNFTRFFVGLIIILGVFSSQELFAGIESSGWGEIKSQFSQTDVAGKIIASPLTISNPVRAIRNSGRLSIEDVPASMRPRMRIVTAGSHGEEVLRFRQTSFGESGVTWYTFGQSVLAEEVGAKERWQLSSLYNFSLSIGGKELYGISSFGMSSAKTGLIDFRLGSAAHMVPSFTTEDVVLHAWVNTWPSISSGSVHRFSFRPSDVGLTKRTSLFGSDEEIFSNFVVVRRSHPVIEYLPLPSFQLPGGFLSQVTGAHWRVHPAGNSLGLDVHTRHKKITFQVAWTDCTPTVELEMSNFKLYRNGTLLSQSEYTIYDGLGTEPENILSHGGSSVLSLANFPGSLANVVLVFGDRSRGDMQGEEIVIERNSNEYQLRFDVINAHQGSSTDEDSIIITMLGDDEEEIPITGDLQPHPTGVVTVGQKNYNFIWSDYSAQPGQHSSAVPTTGSADWTNGFLVPTSYDHGSFLPLDPWTLSK